MSDTSSALHMKFNWEAYLKARQIMFSLFGEDIPQPGGEYPISDTLPFVEIEDCDTPFAVGPASLAVWEALRLFRSAKKGLTTKKIVPDHALLSLRQERYLELDRTRPSLWDEWSGMYECADGSLVQLHCNFECHRLAAIKALDYPSNASEAKARSKAMFATGHDLANRVLECGGAAAVVQPYVPQAPSELGPLVDIKAHKIVGNDLKNNQTTTNNSSKINIVDLTRVLAGPVSTHVLKEVLQESAQVLTVSSKDLPQIEPARLLYSRGKQSAFCDFHNEQDLASFHTLLGDCDVFVQSYRASSLNKFGLGDEDFIHKLAKPGAVKVNIRAYDQHVNRRGYDSLVQCHSGMFDEHSKFVGRKEHLPVQALDYLTGMLAALGALVAINRRTRFPNHVFTVDLNLERTARFLLDELPRRTQQNRGPLGHLQRIEQRIMPNIFTRRVLSGSGREIGYLRGVLTSEEEENQTVFAEQAGQSPLKWT